jgi:hypothetical protein
MSIWIITTGNSDVQLNKDSYWEDFHEAVRYDDKDIRKCDKFAAIQEDKATDEVYPVPARILGIVYRNHVQENYDDLAFPLLDTFTQYFLDKPNEKPSIIIVLLTDQRNIFVDEDGDLNEKVENEFSPFWQDTCTLKLIFQEYFKQKEIFSSIKLEFCTLRPSKKGLDNWNETLEVVQKEFKNIQEKLREYPEYKPDETVYVSHQAGTPAISSAVQFVSLSNFKKVNFLSSNIFFNNDNKPASEPQIVEISNYWMGIQIEKAKQLVRKGLPGAALSMLEEIGYVDTKNVIPRLKNMVSVFNIRESLTKGHEFDVIPAIQRVVDALILVEIFFQEKNYLQGIALLAAAHETFLKAAIASKIYNKKIILNIDGKQKTFLSQQLVKWQQPGLVFIRNVSDNYSDKTLKSVLGIPDWDRDIKKIVDTKYDVLHKMSFPVNNYPIFQDTKASDKNKNKAFDVTNSNAGLFNWLDKLRVGFKPWSLLTWICIEKDKYKEYDDDLRNGLMHNLLGFNEQDVIKYLLGNPKTLIYTDVLTTYRKEVKEKFLNEIKNLGIPYNERNLYDELEAIANDII